MKTEPTEALKNLIREVFDAYDSDGQDIENIVDYESAKKAVRSAFEEGQSSPKIKQLEWENHGSSITAVGLSDYTYYINLKDDHATLSLRNNSQIIVLGPYSRPNEAKAAAQADFEKRVKKCLM